MKQRPTIGYKVGFVSCCKTKRKGFFKAKDLYISDLFKKSFSFCLANYDFVYILSAKYGLLNPNDFIEIYSRKLRSSLRSSNDGLGVKESIEKLFIHESQVYLF